MLCLMNLRYILQPVWWYISRGFFHKVFEEWCGYSKGIAFPPSITWYRSNWKPSMFPSLLDTICVHLILVFMVLFSMFQITDNDIRKESTPDYFLKVILPLLKRNSVVHFLGFGNRLAFDPLPLDLQVFRTSNIPILYFFLFHMVCNLWILKICSSHFVSRNTSFSMINLWFCILCSLTSKKARFWKVPL